MQAGAYGDWLGRSFRVTNPPTLQSRTEGGNRLAVTELRFEGTDFGLTDPLARDDAYLIVLHLRAVRRYEMWLDGHSMHAKAFDSGATCFHDLARNPVTYMGEPFHLLAFYLPRAALQEVSEGTRRRPLKDLVYDPQVPINDPVIATLGQSLLPFLGKPSHANQLFIDHILLALRGHLAVAYGGLDLTRPACRGGLAPWQQRKAQELLAQNVIEGISLESLARACCLSSSAFSRGFKKSTGLSPHQWLLHRRIDRAADLLRDRVLSLSEVALSSGFADQSHFTRAFSRRMGTSPGAWRRERAASHALDA